MTQENEVTHSTTNTAARELLAAEYELDGADYVAQCIRRDSMLTTMEARCLRAISAALRSKQPAASEGGDVAAKFKAFKDYTHGRLDAMGVPHSLPESEHGVGGRLDWVEARLKDADRFRRIAGRWDHMKTSASERFLAEMNIEGDVTLPLAEIIDRNGCKAKLAPDQWWNFCGETDMGQTLPVLCEMCEPGGLKRA